MSLTLITGRANTGKTGVVYRPLVDSVRAGETPTLVLPSAPDVRRARAEFADRGLSGIRVTTFKGWVESLWSLHGDGRRIVGPAVRQALVGEVIGGARLELLASSASKPGFARQMAELVSKATIGRLAREQGGVDGELTSLVRAYARACDTAGFIELDEAARALALRGPALPGPVAFNRFADLSQAQIDLILATATTGEIGVALNWEEGCPATSALDDVVGVLADAATVLHHEDARDPETELEFLERDLYRPTAPIEPTGQLVLAETAGPEAEVAVAARMAARFVSQGVPAERIAIVFRHVDKRAHLIRAALANQHLVGDLDVSRSFVGTPFGRAFSSLLGSCCGQEDARERLLAFLA
ncbi:MAG: hypothetical protein Q8M66_00250, partial [Actinomycetota bacterium]|nr:hypothetical protein [Actinomycetota bacterium]